MPGRPRESELTVASPETAARTQPLLASMSLEGMGGAAMAVEGSTTQKVFEAYVEEKFLAPTL
jgi:hypothetical protein